MPAAAAVGFWIAIQIVNGHVTQSITFSIHPLEGAGPETKMKYENMIMILIMMGWYPERR